VDESIKSKQTMAFVPFALFSILLVAVSIVVTVDIVNRSEIKPQSQTEVKRNPMEGELAPDFSLPNLSGKPVSLSSLRGKIVFLNVWATWCAPCREEMPSMERLYKKLKGKNFEMLAVSIDKTGKELVVPFKEELGLTFPILLDPDSKMANAYKTTGVPETFIISQNGVVLHHVIGPTTWDRKIVVKLLKMYISKSAG